MALSFHGATGTVTGSRYLVECNGRRVLVGCGLFQGWKQLRLRKLLLPDSGRLLEEEAEFANRMGSSKHHPAQPLYGEDDAKRSLGHLHPSPFDHDFEPAPGLVARFRPAGRILGAASAHADADELMGWLRAAPRPPRAAFVTHREPDAADALRVRIEHDLGWPARVPDDLERVLLAPS